MESTETPARIPNVHTRIYVSACEKLKLPYRLSLNNHALWIRTKSGKEVLCYKAATPLNLVPQALLSKNKRDTTLTLSKAGLPTPPQTKIKDLQSLELFHRTYKQIVVKPIDGHGGKGITVLPKENELPESLNRAHKISKKVIAEKFVVGKNYRFLVLDGKVLAVSLRNPPLIKGDGQTKVRTLIDDYNMENHAKGLPQVPMNTYTWSIVEAQGYKPNDVLPKEVEVYLRLTANLSLGGTVADVTDECDQSYKDLAVTATKIAGFRLAGIDIISPYIDKPGAEAYIIETNVDPGMRIHYKEEKAAKRDVAVEIMKAIGDL